MTTEAWQDFFERLIKWGMLDPNLPFKEFYSLACECEFRAALRFFGVENRIPIVTKEDSGKLN